MYNSDNDIVEYEFKRFVGVEMVFLLKMFLCFSITMSIQVQSVDHKLADFVGRRYENKVKLLNDCDLKTLTVTNTNQYLNHLPRVGFTSYIANTRIGCLLHR